MVTFTLRKGFVKVIFAHCSVDPFVAMRKLKNEISVVVGE